MAGGALVSLVLFFSSFSLPNAAVLRAPQKTMSLHGAGVSLNQTILLTHGLCFKKPPQPITLTVFGKKLQQDMKKVISKKTKQGLKNPGAGLDQEVEPFKLIFKDGFYRIDCVKDYMFTHGDKFGDNKHEYELEERSNVSIVHYDMVVAKMDRKDMTPQVCFDFCRTIPDMLSFGILNGRECYCEPFSKPMAGDSSDCDATCEGDATQMCGGVGKSTIWEMHMCADTAKDLKNAADDMEDVMKELEADVEMMRDAAEAGQEDAVEGQKNFGQLGDPAASDLMQEAKVVAGKMQHFAEDGQKAVDAMSGLLTKIRASKGPYNTFDAVKKAEAMVADAKEKTEKGEDLFKKFDEKLRLRKSMDTDEGSERVDGRGKLYYPAMYFVDKYGMGTGKPLDNPSAISSCGGDLATEPILGISYDACAYACDAHASDGCNSFNYFQAGNGICFLFKKLKSMTYFSPCGKQKALLQNQTSVRKMSAPPVRALLKSNTSVSGPKQFTWKTKSTQPDPQLYMDSVKGKCTTVSDCGLGGETLQDCTLMQTYQCAGGGGSGSVKDLPGGGLKLEFNAGVSYGARPLYCQVIPDPCPNCKKYVTCSGPYAVTNEMKIRQGDVASFDWSSTGRSDWYEVFVGMYNQDGLVNSVFVRGSAMPTTTFELAAPKTGKYYLKFLLASYDASGGGAVGADLTIDTVPVVTKPAALRSKVADSCMAKLSEFQGTTIKPDGSGKCKNCLKKVQKRCLEM